MASFESKPLMLSHGIESPSGDTGAAVDEDPSSPLRVAPWSLREFDFSKEKKIDRVYFVGVFLAFWLVFSMWCLWISILEYSTKDQGGYPNMKSVLINLTTITACLFVLAFLRYVIGPVLGPFARSVFSLVLVFFAICFWETLEGLVGVAVKDDLKSEAIVYFSLLVTGLIVTAIYEYSTNYDVIGNHLLL